MGGLSLTDAQKKQAQRNREKELGVVTLTVKLSASENEQIERARAIRGGVRGPYDKDEYIATLIRRDMETLGDQLSKIGSCDGCSLKLPEGCRGICSGQNNCYHHLSYRELML